MDVEENLRLMDEYLETFNAHDWEHLMELFSESAVWYYPGSKEPIRGRDAMRESQAGIVKRYPDIREEKKRAFGQGDWVCIEYAITGTNKGPLKRPDGKTIPPTNKRIRIPFCSVYKFKDGKITECCTYYDRLEWREQLGIA